MEPKRIKNRLCRQIEAELSSITDPHLSYAGKAEDCPQDLTREFELIDALYNSEIRKRAVFGKAATLGLTVNNISTGDDSWQDILSLKKEVTKYGK